MTNCSMLSWAGTELPDLPSFVIVSARLTMDRHFLSAEGSLAKIHVAL
jgi:hypothetical protein